MAWYTTLLCMVPPNKGCGWQTSAACVASGWPSFSSASSRPEGPSRKKDLIPLATLFFYHRGHRGTRRTQRPAFILATMPVLVVRSSLASIIVIMCFIGSAHAKDCSTSKEFTLQHAQKLSGSFVDASSAILSGIGVQLLSGRKVICDVHTNNQGAYDLGEVPPGRYRLRISYHHAFCAPRIQCSSKDCKIRPELAINPKNTVIVR